MPLAGGFGGRVKLNEQRFCSAPVCSDYCRLPKERRPRGVFLSPAIKSPKPGHDCHVCTFVAEAASVHSGGVVHGMQEGGPPVVLVLRTLERRTINAQHEHAAAWHRLRFYSVRDDPIAGYLSAIDDAARLPRLIRQPGETSASSAEDDRAERGRDPALRRARFRYGGADRGYPSNRMQASASLGQSTM
jgi:hypothetical protein